MAAAMTGMGASAAAIKAIAAALESNQTLQTLDISGTVLFFSQHAHICDKANDGIW
jgi:hypothetical protein